MHARYPSRQEKDRHLSALPAWMSMYYMHARCPSRQEENIGSPLTGITHDYKPPYGCWKSNLDPLE